MKFVRKTKWGNVICNDVIISYEQKLNRIETEKAELSWHDARTVLLDIEWMQTANAIQQELIKLNPQAN